MHISAIYLLAGNRNPKGCRINLLKCKPLPWGRLCQLPTLLFSNQQRKIFLMAQERKLKTSKASSDANLQHFRSQFLQFYDYTLAGRLVQCSKDLQSDFSVYQAPNTHKKSDKDCCTGSGVIKSAAQWKMLSRRAVSANCKAPHNTHRATQAPVPRSHLIQLQSKAHSHTKVQL